MRAFLLSLMVLVGAGCAQRLDDFESRMSDLDQRTRILESSAGMPVGSDRQLLEGQKLADVRSQLSTLANDVTLMKGDIESLKHENEAMRARLEQMNADVDRRLKAMGERSFVSSKTSGASVQEDYDIALRAHQDGQFSKSRQLFNAFLIKFPTHALSDNALFWIGESYMEEKSYKRAISRFQDLIEKFPKSDKRCDAMGRQVTAFKALNMKKEALAFERVRNAECRKKK